MNTEILFDIIVKNINAVFSVFTEKDKIAKRNNRPCWAIVLKYEGETIYTCAGKKLVSNKNSVMILPKGSSYEWQCVESGRYYSIEFDCDTFCESIFSIPVDNCEKILQLFKEIEHKRTFKRELNNLETMRNLYNILVLTLQFKQKYTPTVKQEKIAPAVDYMLKNYHLKIMNDDLAQLAGLSTIYFRKLFTETFGTSPINYIHKLRIDKAKEMLRGDTPSLTDIAITVGYANISDFSKAFKKHTGITPSNYYKQQLNKNKG